MKTEADYSPYGLFSHPRCSLRLLFVGEGGEGVEDDDEDAEGGVARPQLGHGCALQIDRAQNLYIVSWR